MAGTGTRRAPKARTSRRHLAAAGVGVALPFIGTVAASAADSYTVKSGDTLSEIAAEHGYKFDWKKLYEQNQGVVGNNPDLILPGQKLTLDGSAPSAPAPKKAATTADKTAAKPSSSQRVVHYTVKAGDTLGSIAQKYDVPGGWQRVYEDNKSAIGGNPAALKVGLKLSVDTQGKAVAHPAAATTAKKTTTTKSTSSASTATPTSYTASGIKALARQMVPSGQFECFSNIVTRESGWNYKATNASSGAYGLVQALPGTKMATAGADWRTNPATQIKWGLSYMNSRYGSPCGAWTFWQAHNWY